MMPNNESYDARAPIADRLLKQDGSITTFDGTLVEGPDEYRAELYAWRTPQASKWLMPDGTVLDALPTVSTTVSDHSLLYNLSKADQHPIVAVTGLETRLTTNENAIKSLGSTISKTYAELAALKNTSQLIPGQLYVISDYATKYVQPVSLKLVTCSVEPLTITAEAPNRFSPIAFSAAYPMDAITYNFDNNKCEDNATARNGFILRRVDPTRNIDLAYDWRFIKWARFKVDTSVIPVWESGAVTKGGFYLTGANISKALQAGTPSSVTDSSYFVEVVPGYANNPFLYDSAYGLTKSSDYSEFFTFDNSGVNDHTASSITNIHIGGPYSRSALLNSVFKCSTAKPHSICAIGRFENSTFGEGCHTLWFADGTRGVTLGNNNRSCSFGASCNTFCTGDDIFGVNYGDVCENNVFAGGYRATNISNSINGLTLGKQPSALTSTTSTFVERRSDGKIVVRYLDANNTNQYTVVS